MMTEARECLDAVERMRSMYLMYDHMKDENLKKVLMLIEADIPTIEEDVKNQCLTVDKDQNWPRTSQCTLKLQIISFITKSMDVCCEEIKMVKMMTKGIINPIENDLNADVVSELEGHWKANYTASDWKVGSLSEGLDTVCDSQTKQNLYKHVKKCFGYKNNFKMITVPLDCDTMHTIDGILPCDYYDIDIVVNEPEFDPQIWKKQADPQIWKKQADESKRLLVKVQLSKNPGHRHLKVVQCRPMTEKQDQLLFLFNTDKNGHLQRPKPHIAKDLITGYIKNNGLNPDVFIFFDEPKYLVYMLWNGEDQKGNDSDPEKSVYAIGLDWVPALKMDQWPEEANDWISRDRPSKWPSQDIVKEIVQAGCLLIPKTHSRNPEMKTEWRVSFSEAERRLALTLSEKQKTCFRMFKMVTQQHCKVTLEGEEKCLHSYALKTVFFWACEEFEQEVWENDPGRYYLTLLEKLAEGLEKRNIENYFIPEINEIESLGKEHVQRYLGCVREIQRDPIGFLSQTWKLTVEPELGWSFERVFGDLLRGTDAEELDIAKSRSSLNLALMLKDYICQEGVPRNTFKMELTQAIYRNALPRLSSKMIGYGEEEGEQVGKELSTTRLSGVQGYLDDCIRVVRKYLEKPEVRFGIAIQAFFLDAEVKYLEGRLKDAMQHVQEARSILTSEGCNATNSSKSMALTLNAKCLASLKVLNEHDIPLAEIIRRYEEAFGLNPSNIEAYVHKKLLLNIVASEKMRSKCKAGDDEEIFNTRLIPLSRGDLPVLDGVLFPEVKTLLEWRPTFPRVSYVVVEPPVSVVYVPAGLILSHLHLVKQDINKANLHKELKPYITLIAEAEKLKRVDCQYMSNSLLGFINYDVGNYWEALKTLRLGAMSNLAGHCSERVKTHMNMLATLFKIKVERG